MAKIGRPRTHKEPVNRTTIYLCDSDKMLLERLAANMQVNNTDVLRKALRSLAVSLEANKAA